jgi:hypothetical protein
MGTLLTMRATPRQVRIVAALPFVVQVEGGRAYTNR